MTAVCRFCDQEFANRQAVRAHLKACTPYLAQREASDASGNPPLGKAVPIGKSQGNPPGDGNEANETGFDLVKQLERQVAAGRLSLTLREIDDANAELDRRAEAKEREKSREAERQAALARPPDTEGREKPDREERERRLRERQDAESRRRREVIQDVKQQVIGEPFFGIWPSSDSKADALLGIERALSRLAVTELPRDELLTIARAARDRLYRAAQRAQRVATDAEVQAQRRAAELGERKRRIIQQGVAYAKRELASVDGLHGIDRWRIEMQVETELRSIEGDESWPEIVEIVECVFDSEGIDDDEMEDDG